MLFTILFALLKSPFNINISFINPKENIEFLLKRIFYPSVTLNIL